MITIRGIKIDSVSITSDNDGKEKVSGAYSLMSSGDKVLAKQTFNGYSDIAVPWSAETQKALNELMDGVKNDIQNTLGLSEKES